MNSNRPAKCKNCASTNVTWLQSKAGKWYLADINHGARGSEYTTPHFQTCTVVGPRADRIKATAEHNAKITERESALQELFAKGDYEGMRRLMEGGNA